MPYRISIDADTIAESGKFQEVIENIVGSSEDIHLDMSDFDLSGGRRLAPINLQLLANLFAGSSSDTVTKVTLPTTDSGRLHAMRSGFYFYLVAHRSQIGNIEIIHPNISDNDFAEWKRLWSQPWSPREPIVGRLFEDDPRIVDVKKFFKNPRNAKRATRIVVDILKQPHDFIESALPQGLAHRWLQLVTPTSNDPKLVKQRDIWMSLVSGRILMEPFLNVVDHAGKRPPEYPPEYDMARCPPRPCIKSVGLIARTEGGSGSYPRLQLLVTDNGYGLVNTLRPKLLWEKSKSSNEIGNSSASDILDFAVMRDANTAQDRGLPWARTSFEVAVSKASKTSSMSSKDIEADFTIMTGDPDNNNSAIWITAKRDGTKESGTMSALPFVGTTVFVTMPMPCGQPVQESDEAQEPEETRNAIPSTLL
ncbi:MAG: hypothetical protein F4213_16105 [Boseongicola sp. SB0677_bin_26]|nr:hypothetical protein [Boseongicola sp. SB0677_bin_26]